MTINESSMIDLMSYRRVVLSSSAVILLALGTLLALSFYSEWLHFQKPLAGAFIGSFLASLNVLALGYAFFKLVLKKSPRKVVLWPVATFLSLCGVALFMALTEQDYLLGFALGLTTPLIFGAIIALRA